MADERPPVAAVHNAAPWASAPPTSRARAIALYLPQFYPTPENDAWWGPGFTEWTNVIQRRPLFEGHWQPRLPAETGFYDLRVPEVRALQADLARQHGIEAFCYWHYWFGGERLLERPFDEVLASGEPDFPFCLSWANESWSRRWHGTGDNQVLKLQTYSAADDQAHGRWLATAFADPRYLTVNGRPLFVIYRPFDLPEPRRTLDAFRHAAVEAGLREPLVLGMNAHRPDGDARTVGCDLTLNFEPQLSAVAITSRVGPHAFDYGEATRAMRARTRPFPTVPSVVVSWDNTPRRPRDGIVFLDSSPEAFGAGLREVVDGLADRPLEERLVFLNAWNEWAEGNYLEPDLRYGRGWLEAVRGALA